MPVCLIVWSGHVRFAFAAAFVRINIVITLLDKVKGGNYVVVGFVTKPSVRPVAWKPVPFWFFLVDRRDGRVKPQTNQGFDNIIFVKGFRYPGTNLD